MGYERTEFFVPNAPDGAPNQAAPPPAKKPIPGPSKFVASSQVQLDWANVPDAVIAPGPGAADQYIAERLARASGVVRQPTAATPRERSGGGAVPISSYYPNQPWTEMPPNGIPYDFIGVTDPTPAAGAAETVTLAFRVPTGLDGVIKRIYNDYTGGGFEEGTTAPSIRWRIRRSGQPVKNYENIRVRFGSLQEGRLVEGGILIFADQLIEFTVEHEALSPLPSAGTRILCGVKGWYWPRR
jgi:hypothetical protein